MLSRPNSKLEESLTGQRYKFITGLDEAGRGAWAGPVVAGALTYEPLLKKVKGVNDSKLLTAKKREEIFEVLVSNFDCSAGVVDSRIIDQIGIVEAVRLAMRQAIAGLKSKADYLLIDAFLLPAVGGLPQQAIIKGDQKILSIAAASIVAKVTRDRLMGYYNDVYSGYGFGQHKGYGTANHYEKLKDLGICDLHRRCYRPISQLLNLVIPEF